MNCAPLDERPMTVAPRDLPRLLVIDDDELFQAQIALSLAGRFAVEGRLGAVDNLTESLASVDTVILDLNMPDVDGLSFIARLATLECPPKLMIISGHDATILELAYQAALLQGLHRTRVLRKPVTRQQLLMTAAELDSLPAADAASSAPGASRAFSDAEVISASRAGHLDLLYQPQICLRSAEVVGVEALVRWHHPSLGCVVPARFIHAMEDSSHAEEFTLAIAEQAIRDTLHLTEHRGYTGKISINVPPKVLESRTFTDSLIALVAAQGLPPRRLQCEVTERGLYLPDPQVSASLARLRMCGIQLAMDDFGIGTSGLWKVKTQAFDELKIDRSFIQEMAECAKSRSIVESIMFLARRLGMRVIAEGIEDERTHTLSLSMGVAHAQGFHCARPMSRSDLEIWLSEWQARLSSGNAAQASCSARS